MIQKVLLLHPGEMGTSIGSALISNKHEVVWVSQNRSNSTKNRASENQFVDKLTLMKAVAYCDHIIAICPPTAATEVALSVKKIGFEGIYIDANAISPSTASQIQEIVGSRFVDGGIIGPPAWKEDSTRLYLSGKYSEEVASWFRGSLVDARSIENSASALKMSYAAYTKGSSALILSVRALAKKYGIEEALLEEWKISQPGLKERSEFTASGTAGKAWRFEGEMLEIAKTFLDAELPDGFHKASSEIYKRMADFKDSEEKVMIERVIKKILN
ncbi:MAG TPA: NAD(P)-dependent oxidoreductase [Gammaproteobacteria bacterium]|nr:NAD(P)-dependent oxidoreductase [Gammaproteobacteria bacterium]